MCTLRPSLPTRDPCGNEGTLYLALDRTAPDPAVDGGWRGGGWIGEEKVLVRGGPKIFVDVILHSFLDISLLVSVTLHCTSQRDAYSVFLTTCVGISLI